MCGLSTDLSYEERSVLSPHIVISHDGDSLCPSQSRRAFPEGTVHLSRSQAIQWPVADRLSGAQESMATACVVQASDVRDGGLSP